MVFEKYEDVIDAFERDNMGYETLTDYIKGENIRIMEIEMTPLDDLKKTFSGADGGSVGIEILFGPKREDFNIGGNVQKATTPQPYDSRATVADFARAIDNVGAGTNLQKAIDIDRYGKNIQKQNMINRLQKMNPAGTGNFLQGIKDFGDHARVSQAMKGKTGMPVIPEYGFQTGLDFQEKFTGLDPKISAGLAAAYQTLQEGSRALNPFNPSKFLRFPTAMKTAQEQATKNIEGILASDTGTITPEQQAERNKYLASQGQPTDGAVAGPSRETIIQRILKEIEPSFENENSIARMYPEQFRTGLDVNYLKTLTPDEIKLALDDSYLQGQNFQNPDFSRGRIGGGTPFFRYGPQYMEQFNMQGSPLRLSRTETGYNLRNQLGELESILGREAIKPYRTKLDDALIDFYKTQMSGDSDLQQRIFGLKDGGRVGLFMGGPALEGTALDIYNSMSAYGFSDAEIADALRARGLYDVAPVVETPVINTAPNIINQREDGPSQPPGGFDLGYSSENFGLGPNQDVVDYESEAYNIGPTVRGQFAKGRLGIQNLISKMRSLPTPLNIALNLAGKVGDFFDPQRETREAISRESVRDLQDRIDKGQFGSPTPTPQDARRGGQYNSGGGGKGGGKGKGGNDNPYGGGPGGLHAKDGGLATMFKRKR